ncbi:MAG: glycosyltransferase family 4 protein [Thermoleophilia bacterium]
MKILQINKFWRVRGGSERYVFELSRLLEESGHETIPFAMRDPANEPSTYSSLFVSPVELSDPYRLGLTQRLGTAARILRSREAGRNMSVLADLTHPDVAHCHNIYHHLSPSILPPLQKRGIGIVMTLHDYKLMCPALRFYNGGGVCERCRPLHYGSCFSGKCVKGSRAASLLCAVEMFYHDATKAYTGRIDRFIAPSRFMADKLLERDVPPGKVVVIPNFIDTASWQPGEGERDYVLFAGRMSLEKGVETLIRAMAKLPDIPLKIAGTGMLEREYRTITHELGARNIEFLGFRSEEEIRRLTQGARFTAVPSEWYENAPMTILESFACGTPVVGARIGGIPELVREGQTGMLFEPGDITGLRRVIESLWDRSGPCAQMGAAARQLAEDEYSPATHYDKILDVYQQVKRT